MELGTRTRSLAVGGGRCTAWAQMRPPMPRSALAAMPCCGPSLTGPTPFVSRRHPFPCLLPASRSSKSTTSQTSSGCPTRRTERSRSPTRTSQCTYVVSRFPDRGPQPPALAMGGAQACPHDAERERPWKPFQKLPRPLPHPGALAIAPSLRLGRCSVPAPAFPSPAGRALGHGPSRSQRV